MRLTLIGGTRLFVQLVEVDQHQAMVSARLVLMSLTTVMRAHSHRPYQDGQACEPNEQQSVKAERACGS